MGWRGPRCPQTESMDVAGFLEQLTADPAYAGQVCYRCTVESAPPVLVPIPASLGAAARAFLEARGIRRL